MKKVIREAERIPDWYGIAYREMWSMTTVCYPLGINLVVRQWRRILTWLKVQPTLIQYETAFDAIERRFKMRHQRLIEQNIGLEALNKIYFDQMEKLRNQAVTSQNLECDSKKRNGEPAMVDYPRIALNKREDVPEGEIPNFCTWFENGVEYGKWFAESELVKVSKDEMDA